VLNFDTSVAALLEFLELRWNDKVRDYASTAKSRAIDTPSAPDVRLPLYRSSIGRWRKYAKVAAEQFSILEPWVRAYGYDKSTEEG
jgi:hypothetical protein